MERNDSKDNFEVNFQNFCDNNNNNNSSSNDNNHLNEPNKKKHFLCLRPQHYIPTFIINEKIKITCQCGRKEELSYRKVLDDFVCTTVNINLDTYYKCQKKGHKEKKLKYYCLECNMHFCKICSRLSNKHKNHKNKIVILEKEKEKTKILAKKIDDRLKKIKNIDIELKELFNVIYDNFNNYTMNYSYICIFNEYDKYLKNKFPNEI